MKKILLTIFVIAPLLFVAQNIKKEKVKSSYLSYPIINASNVDVSTLTADYCLGDLKFMSKKLSKVSVACKNNLTKKIVAIEAFYYQFSVLEPVGYTKISDASGKVIAMEKTTLGNKGTVDYGKSQCANNTESRLKANYEKGKSKFESKSKSQYTKGGLKDASNYINRALFFTYIPQNLVIYYVKSKKQDYSDLERAASVAKDGYGVVKNNVESKDGQSKLKQAASMWEKALTESNPSDKGARINRKVTLHISENLATAYLYMMEFEKAKNVISKALDLEKNITTDGTRRRRALLEIIKQNSKGYAVNKNTPINLKSAKVSIKTHASSNIGTFKTEYKKYGYVTVKEDYDKGIASGEINPYQKYVVAVAGGNMLTLPDLGAKLTKAPAGNKLDKFPETITALDLTTLILRNNNLTSIPPSIGKMTKLKKLVLTNNKLTNLPDEIGQLTNLKNLVLKGNNIPTKEINRIQSMLPNCKIKL
ncbi:MAG: hypothetical protein COA97_07105 [Flavobacteriales bacterium]|nr:MAG: hypothetical protein COA97_07105 [Flavobacteriales bacterium]